MDDHVGHDIGRLLAAVIARRFGLEQRDDLGGLGDHLHGYPGGLGDLGVAMLFQQGQVRLDDLRGQRILHPEVGQLQVQALLQVASGDAGGIQALHAAQHLFHRAHFAFKLRGEVLQRSFEVAIVIEVVNDGGADPLFVLGKRREPQLPD